MPALERLIADRFQYVIMQRPAGCLQHHDRPNHNGSCEDAAMAARPLPSPEVVRQLLRYEPETGRLFWLPRPVEYFRSYGSYRSWNTRYSGNEALCAVDRDGYRHLKILYVRCLAHRAAWAHFYGRWPAEQIDHINLNKIDNRICNLREATNSENSRNKGIGPENTSGFKGVYWISRYKKWGARIGHDNRHYHLGTFDCPKKAHAAYCAAAYRLHGEFARVA